VNFVPLHFDHTPERLKTTGRRVVLEMLAFGLLVVVCGALIILVSSNRLVGPSGVNGSNSSGSVDDDRGSRKSV